MFFYLVLSIRGAQCWDTCVSVQEIQERIVPREMFPEDQQRLTALSEIEWVPGMFVKIGHWTIFCVSEEVLI